MSVKYNLPPERDDEPQSPEVDRAGLVIGDAGATASPSAEPAAAAVSTPEQNNNTGYGDSSRGHLRALLMATRARARLDKEARKPREPKRSLPIPKPRDKS